MNLSNGINQEDRISIIAENRPTTNGQLLVGSKGFYQLCRACDKTVKRTYEILAAEEQYNIKEKNRH